MSKPLLTLALLLCVSAIAGAQAPPQAVTPSPSLYAINSAGLASAMTYCSTKHGNQMCIRDRVLDVGGGTTDIAHAQIGGRGQEPVIHRAWGLPNGGTDVDLALSMAHFMPLFGKGDSRIPMHHLSLIHI